MATALFPAAVPLRVSRAGWFGRFVNALMDTRMCEAERLVQRYQPLVHETALINGAYRRIGLAETDKLPFNA